MTTSENNSFLDNRNLEKTMIEERRKYKISNIIIYMKKICCLNEIQQKKKYKKYVKNSQPWMKQALH